VDLPESFAPQTNTINGSSVVLFERRERISSVAVSISGE
jgi:hypothetical protein